MKVNIIILLMSIGFAACSNSATVAEGIEDDSSENLQEDLEDPETVNEQWKLVKMTGSMPNSEVSGEDMPYQENYQFNEDGSFSKTRETEEGKITAEGTYELVENEDGLTYQLDYPNDSEIIVSCSGNSEYLYFAEDGTTLLSGAWACDHAGHFYEKIASE